MITVDNKFSIGEVVYLRTDEDQKPRIITSIIVNKYDLLYEMICGTSCSRHYDFEITEDANILIKN